MAPTRMRTTAGSSRSRWWDRLPPPSADFSPTSGPIGTSVTIGGSGFTGATDVKFNGTSVGSGNFAVVSGAQITATADTFVRSDDPTLHPGTKISLRVDNNPIKHRLLKFTVSGVGSGSIQSVKLRRFCLDASDKGGDFYRLADNSWQENTVTWNTELRPIPRRSHHWGPLARTRGTRWI